jgi:copper transport protein
MREVAGTRFGEVWTIAVIAWLVIAAAGTTRRWYPPWSALPALVFLVAAPALSGHATTQSPLAMVPANVLHVGAMAAWIGGLAAIVLVVPSALAGQQPAQRSRPLHRILARFSTVALVSVAALLVTGLVQAYVEIRRLNLVLETGFGRAVLIKLVLLGALVALGAVQRRRNLPRLKAAAAAGRSPGADGVLLRRTLLAEMGLAATALLVTGALAGYAPATAAGIGPFEGSGRIGGQRFDLTVDPASVGANAVHLYLTDPDSGTPVDKAKEVSISALEPDRNIGPIAEPMSKSGPGHYTATALALGVAGSWEITLTVRVSDFDEYTSRVRVRVSG